MNKKSTRIPRMSMVTLGVNDLAQSVAFYSQVLGTPPNTKNEGVAFFELPGVWLSLFPRQNLAQDIAPDLDPCLAPDSRGFSGITLAHNAQSRAEVLAIFEHVKTVGGRIVKAPNDTFWGGFSGYFADPDGYYWEVAWGPMFEFTDDGTLRFKKIASDKEDLR